MVKTLPPVGQGLNKEDWLLYELLSILRGQRPVTNKRFDFSGWAGTKRGGSANHPDLAIAAQAVEGQRQAIKNFTEQRADRTDFGMNEPWSRNAYGPWSLASSLAVYRATKSAPIREWLEHFLAGMIAMSSAPTDWKMNIVCMAGARSGKKGCHRIGSLEWIVALMFGNEPAKLRQNMVGKRDSWPEDYTSEILFNLRPEIVAIGAPIVHDFLKGGWSALAKYFRYGTRVEHRIIRTSTYVLSYLGKNCNGNTPPTWAVIAYPDGRIYWHPDTDERVRQKFDSGRAWIEGAELHAESEFFGSFKRQLPPGDLQIDVRQHPAGCTVEIATTAPQTPQAPQDTRDPNAGTVFAVVPRKRNWFQRLLGL